MDLEKFDMKPWRIGIAILIVLAIVGIVAFALTWRSEIPAVAEDAQPDVERTLASKGYALAQLGNCASCHTAKDGKPYAGGLAMPTPFGTIYSTNITSDRDTGIGTWSEEAFARAMRKGIDREGGHLYPAFPYNHFTKASDDDIHALYTFLRSVPAVRNDVSSNDLTFPFNIRPLIAGWNFLFLDTDQLEPVSDQSEQWNRGRYLVEGLTHCGACHTPRNIMGAEKSSEKYQGAMIDNWYAPPLSGDAARNWQADQLDNYLATGFNQDHGAAAGPMAETAVNLSQAPPSDVEAIAVYIASLNDGKGQRLTPIDNQDIDVSASAHDLWVGSCAKCHESTAEVGPSKALPLSFSGAVRQSSPANAVRTIVNGIDAYRDMGGAYMPGFADILSNDEVAELAQYIRRRYSNEAEWSELEDVISTARSSAKGKE
ncbi:c-type cytochrome [Halomonas sp. M20]|uniref:c-type cytochrome n=1 Tax=Halomonas sp. M20 TaxID=2763264 RepID=UPI001D09E30D|nr:cytochrome c [Halomonas sp. M20]